MLNFIDIKFILDSVRLGLFSCANILQIADVDLRVSSCRSCDVLSFYFV